MTKALYRRYRPTRLEQVVGQDQVIKPLTAALQQGNIRHAYIFIGPRGTGKTSIARILAHEINKFPYEIEDFHLDIIEIDAASNTGVDNIRNLRDNAVIAPNVGKYKVYIIDEFHMLSKQAFNALLKLLEEPPAHIVFIMATTDAHKIPVTITSRAQVYTFKLATPDIIIPYLRQIATKEQIPLDDSAFTLLAQLGGGSFRDTLSLLDQLTTLPDNPITADTITTAFGLPAQNLVAELLSLYNNTDIATLAAKLKILLEQGLRPETIAEELSKAILANPSPTALNLLNHLFEVSASPFPEAKLLLALTTPLWQQSAIQAVPTPVSHPVTARHPQPPRPTPSVSLATSTPPAPLTPSPEPLATYPAPVKSASATSAPPTTKTSTLHTNANNWQTELLSRARSASVAIYAQLKSATLVRQDHAILITPASSTSLRILSSEHNKAVLDQLFAGQSYTLLNPQTSAPAPLSTPTAPATATPPSPPTPQTTSSAPVATSPLDQISDIMGGELQEINLDDVNL